MASVSSRLNIQLRDVLVLKQCLKRYFSTCSISRNNTLNTQPARERRSWQVSHCKLRIVQQRGLSSHTLHTDSKNDINPFQLAKPEIDHICNNINKTFRTHLSELREMAQYYFDGQGKTFRPLIVLLMAKTLNAHENTSDVISQSQKQVAMITEMIHTASLVHDDVIDNSSTRRGKPTVDNRWGQRKAILVGDYILSVSSMLLAQLRNEEVVKILSQVIEDLVRGEFMQLGSKEEPNDRFNHYLKKTYKKTASLMANSCKAVAVLNNCSEEITQVAFEYGRNIGMAFQLIDDLLDFTSQESIMGKPTAADLKLGLATAPVLYAAQEHRELNALIMRRFCHEGDVELARNLVAKSDGVYQTRLLAEAHSVAAIKLLNELRHSKARDALENVASMVLSRKK
ncbi:all trans-polyprenyl-diphosphate synthase PDSS1-like [Saccostrea echinata]|uniref:all trans-polyprenyl-diphosphate synthase PDSS1-like n=1 Tax=Saccostrea echinata TaxID=191078 RepID=UPI002A8271AD|nr:all trans-polyprenyl-diphosphate synthase PDSS1-like [Saccostrea echinata]